MYVCCTRHYMYNYTCTYVYIYTCIYICTYVCTCTCIYTHTYTCNVQMGISDGLGSRKLEVLADTAVTLEQNTEGAVVTEVIKKILKV